MKVRIKFAKFGVMKFIGHLDVMRFFQKAVRRADIDIRYSEGFSPHQIMSFAAPLGVGIESTGEYLDIEVNSMTSTEEMKAALNHVMVEGISVLSVSLLPDTVKNAMASVAAAGYKIVYTADASEENSVNNSVEHSAKSSAENSEDNISAEFPISGLEQKLQAFYAQEHIPVTKTTKKSVVEMDIKSGIFDLKTEESGSLQEAFPDKYSDAHPYSDGNPVISMLLDASSSGNIKPTMVMEELCKFCQTEYVTYNWQIIRTETYTKAEDGSLIPLSAVGN